MIAVARHVWGPVKALFSWYGRVDRRGFAGAAFGLSLAFFPVDLVGSLAWSSLNPDQVDGSLPASLRAVTPPADLAGPIVAVAAILVGLLALAMLSISIRRLHDMSLSGWCVFVAVFGLAVLPKIEMPSPFGSAWLWVWLVALSVLRGDAGANVFGPPPQTGGTA